MKLIPYRLHQEEYDMNIFYGAYSPIRDRLTEKYGTEHLKFTPFQKVIELGNPNGKSILDLGCGSINAFDDTVSRVYEPWLARALHEFGAKVTGIDIGGLENEKFTGYNTDLLQPNSLSYLNTNSIDIAIASSFFDSDNIRNKKDSFKLLLPQLERIVKPDGYFIFDKLNTGY